MIDQIKPKNLGTDLNNNKVTNESVSNKVSVLRFQKLVNLPQTLSLIMERFRSSFPKKRLKKWQVNHLLIRQLFQELKLQ